MTIEKVTAPLTIYGDDWIPFAFGGLVVWAIIWGCITKAVSSSKGYDGGFAWGFFLGLIGLIVVACKPDNRPIYSQRPNYAPTPSNTGNNSVVFCRSCGTANSSNSTTCQSCGAKLASISSLKYNNANSADSWKCPCGAKNYDYETSCHRCGKLKSEVVGQAGKSEPQKSLTDQLEELKKLQEQGLITEADFEAKKKQILNL